MSNSNFNMSFDSTTKKQFASIVAEYGLTVPQAFKLFANQVIKTGVLPLSFDWNAKKDLELTNKVLEILEKNQLEQKQQKSKTYADLNSLMVDLANDKT